VITGITSRSISLTASRSLAGLAAKDAVKDVPAFASAVTHGLRYEEVNPGSATNMDPSTCDLKFDDIRKIDGDASALEGQTATVTTTGPLQPTYTATVTAGRMEFKATVPGSVWSTGPANGCQRKGGDTAQWGLKLATVAPARVSGRHPEIGLSCG
jgi:hypothetical protein